MQAMEKETVSFRFRQVFVSPGFWVILVGAVFRLVAWNLTYVVNPDGTLYIHQARALYYGLWDQVTPCGTGFLSNYALVISAVYPVFGDWILAARAVSVLFGTLTLIPLYFLLRRFFDETTSALSLLIFAVMPVLVGRSADVVRDPLYWCFLVLGMYFFVSGREKSEYTAIFLSSLSFLMASWARVEAMAAVFISVLYLIFFHRGARLKTLTVFLIPVIGVGILSFLAVWFYGLPPSGLYRSHEILQKIWGPISHYGLLRTHLAGLAERVQDPLLKYFLPEARNFAWLVGLGTLANRTLEAFFYPLFAVFLVGAFQIRMRLKKDPALFYFMWIILAGFCVLYLHVLQWWILDNRHMAIVIFPAAVFAGLGVQRLRLFCGSRLGLAERPVFLLIFALIVAVTLFKNIQPREKDKLVFKTIGEKAARISGNDEEIRVAASMDTLRWFSFYANLHFPGAPCPQPYNDFHALVGDSYKAFVSNLRRSGVQYFLWEKRHWPRDRFEFLQKANPKDFTEIGRWRHRDTGEMILFQVRSK